MNQAASTSALRSTAALLSVMLFVTYAYFFAAPSWNENSRFALTRSLVERGRLDIDPYQFETGDKSFRAGHHYSDKAPGASFLATPAYAAYFAYVRFHGGTTPLSRMVPAVATTAQDLPRSGDALSDEPDVQFNPDFRRALYLCNLVTNAVAGAVLGSLFFLHAVRLGASPAMALFGSLALGLGSLVFPYSTVFYGHVLCACFLFAAFVIVTSPDGLPRTHSGRLVRRAGFLLGLAILCELPAAVPAALLGLYAYGRTRDKKTLVALATGAFLPLLLLLAYQGFAFGNPLRPGYALVSRPEFARGMSQGVLGVGLPRPRVLVAMLVGRSRGLLYLAPVMGLGFMGLVRGSLQIAPWRRPVWLCALIVVYFLLLNAGYYMWNGGAALGPRHIIPALPFLCVGIVFALRGLGRGAHCFAGALLLFSIFNQAAATAVAPTAPPVADLLADHVYRHFWDGDVAIASGATNLGLIMGLPGPASLLPLALLWFLAMRVLVSSLKAGSDAS